MLARLTNVALIGIAFSVTSGAMAAEPWILQVPGRSDQIFVREGQFQIETQVDQGTGSPRYVIKVSSDQGVGFCIVQFEFANVDSLSIVDTQARNLFKDADLPNPTLNESLPWAKAYSSQNDRIVMGIVYYSKSGKIHWLNKVCNHLGNRLISVRFTNS